MNAGLALPLGAARLHEGTWRLFSAQRWLPDSAVTAITVETDGTAWVGTKNGLSRLSTIWMSLEEKATHYDTLVQKYHVRHGYVTVRRLLGPGTGPRCTGSPTQVDDNLGATRVYGPRHPP